MEVLEREVKEGREGERKGRREGYSMKKGRWTGILQLSYTELHAENVAKGGKLRGAN